MSDIKFESDINFTEFYKEKDAHYWKKIESLIKEHGLDSKKILQNYMAFVQRRDLPQLLAYYDLFKEIQNLPGSIIEVGVYLGNGLFTWSKLLETFCPGNKGKKVFGFDNFKGYEAEVSDIDKNGIDYIKGIAGDFKVDKEIVNELIKLANLDNITPGVERVKLYEGDLRESINKFKIEEPGVRISLLVIDVNLYTPTKIALEELYARIVKGGIILLRGYGVKPWEGESQAVDEFLNGKDVEVGCFPFSRYPAIYFRKR